MWRGQIPLGTLVSTGMAEGRIDMQLWNEKQLQAANPDVVVFQRQIEHSQFEAMRAARKVLPNAHFVYELDDFLAGVPDASYHEPFMPPGLAERVRTGISLCDSVSTTTENMAAWLREISEGDEGGGNDIRVIPNLIPAGRQREREIVPGRKLRIGWTGGISHTGDLKLIAPAMAEIGDQVQWVFMGMVPEDVPVKIERRDPVPPMAYMDALATLDCDLMLAPLEDNRFNRCKSNLRLLDATIVGASVIAQRPVP